MKGTKQYCTKFFEDVTRFSAPVLLAATLTACGGSSVSIDDIELPPEPVAEDPAPASAFVRVTHASPDAPAVNVLANGDVLGGLENVDYQVASGWIEVPAGDYDVQVDGILPDASTTAVISATLTLEGEMTYDVLAVDTTANIMPLVISNPFTAVTAGNARVQVVHGAPGAPQVDIYVTAPGDDLTAATPLATAAFMDFTGQVEVPAGDYQIRITPAGDGTVVFDSGTIALADGADLLVTATDNVGAGTSPVTLLVADGTASSKIWDSTAGSHLRVVHAVADGPAVDVIANNELTLVDAAPFLAGTDYLPVAAADYLIDVAADADNSIVVVDDAPVTLENGVIYTAIAHNTLANIALDLKVDTPRPIATAAQVRIIHASPAAGDVDIYVTADGNIADVDPAFTAVPFSSPMLAETGYVQLAAGDYFVTVTVTGSKDAALETGMLTLEASKIYTALAVDANGGGLLPQLILLDDFID